jgi:serine/threonine-protein kinase RsbW
VLRLRLVAEPAAVRVALVRIAAELERRAIPAERAAAAELVLAEVLNNIAEHAFAGAPPGAVEVSLRFAGGAIACEVRDGGRPMPGGRPPAPTPPLATAESRRDLPEGGFGWFLILSLAEELEYFRDGRRNVLRFRLPLTGGAPSP